MEVRSRRAKESSPDRAKVCMQARVKPIRRVQVVYYLTRNGQLEHPHYMEVTHLATQPLRLRDVMERLTVLRGKGMPSLYSWSCKRSYKNGYVWNDLAENDIIFPSDGAEYVLKGSELVERCSERFQQHQVSNRPPHMREPNDLHPKQKPFTNLSRHSAENEDTVKTAYEDPEFDEEEQEEEVEEEEYEDEEKTSYTCSTTPHSRCSRGVSTDELEDQEQPNKNPPDSTHHDSSQPLLTSSSILSEKSSKTNGNNTSQRFEDGDPHTTGSASSRNSVLLQLISCGNLAVAKAKTMPTLKQPTNNSVVKRSENLHRGVLCKSAVKVVDDDKIMISYISENPRFGNLQAEEKEYFSGSIVESMSDDRAVAGPVLKKSNSYNEERAKNAGLGEAAAVAEDGKRNRAVMTGRCLPIKKSSTPTKK